MAKRSAANDHTLTRFMLRDEAIDVLLTIVEESSAGWLTVRADNGLFRASYATGVTPVEGDESPSLTNALTSLLEKMS